MKDLGGLKFAAHLKRNRVDHRLVNPAGPLVSQYLFVGTGSLMLQFVFVNRVQQPSGLVLFNVETGELQKSSRVVTGVNHLWLNANLVAIFFAHDGQLTNVESKFVQLLHST